MVKCLLLVGSLGLKSIKHFAALYKTNKFQQKLTLIQRYLFFCFLEKKTKENQGRTTTVEKVSETKKKKRKIFRKLSQFKNNVFKYFRN